MRCPLCVKTLNLNNSCYLGDLSVCDDCYNRWQSVPRLKQEVKQLQGAMVLMDAQLSMDVELAAGERLERLRKEVEQLRESLKYDEERLTLYEHEYGYLYPDS